MASGDNNVRVLVILGILALFGIITFALAAATLGTLNKRLDSVDEKLSEKVDLTTNPPQEQLNSVLAASIGIEQLMNHLEQFENFAKESGNTRAIGTPGFAKTLDYIEQYLKDNSPGLKVFREEFPVKNFTVKGDPELSWTAGGVPRQLIYSANLARAEFTYVNYSAPNNGSTFSVALVANRGCVDADWVNVSGRAALVIAGGVCTYAEKGELAMKHNATALLYYNNGETTTSLAPAIVRLRQVNTLPALFLSYAAGQELANAINNGSSVSVTLKILLEDYGSFTVENICADTIEGLANETIIIGSHSDSVPAGPGINDNGSGSAANLVLATNLARLYVTPGYAKYTSRVRFCWFAAEEIGLVGSIAHVQQAQSLNPTNTIKDYLINLNFDMLGSPNYIFGIYNGSSANPNTPKEALNGSIRVSEVFREWFIGQDLPWDYTDFSGRSDYGPFLSAGIVAGGLFSGADDLKTDEQRDKYELKLGKGRGGLAGAIADPCYHKACDTLKNIDQFGYLKLVQAAAYMLEYVGRKENLVNWLYPGGRPALVRLPDDYFPNSDYFRGA